jgi:UDP-N-acetylglucosamine 2-epimerase
MKITIVLGTRPESVEAGSNILAGAIPDRILDSSQIMLGRDNNWQTPLRRWKCRRE